MYRYQSYCTELWIVWCIVKLGDIPKCVVVSDDILCCPREQSYMESVVTFLQDVVPQVWKCYIARSHSNLPLCVSSVDDFRPLVVNFALNHDTELQSLNLHFLIVCCCMTNMFPNNSSNNDNECVLSYKMYCTSSFCLVRFHITRERLCCLTSIIWVLKVTCTSTIVNIPLFSEQMFVRTGWLAP